MGEADRLAPAFVQGIRLLFDGRRDAHGEGLGRMVIEEVDDRVIQDHLSGKRRIGIYPIAGPKLDRIKFGAIDIDIPDWELAWLLAKRFGHYKVAAHVERTKSKGWHVWVFFAAWVEAWKVRALIRTVIADLDDRVPGPLEVFPKQDEVPVGGYGNYINLPLFGADAPHGRTCFCVADAKGAPVQVPDWNPAAVEPTKESDLEDVVEMLGLTRQAPAAAHAPLQLGLPTNGAAPPRPVHDALLPCALRMHRDGAPSGSRNAWSFRLAIHFKHNGYDLAKTTKLMLTWNTRNQPPMDAAELVATIKSAFDPKHKNESYGCEDPLILPVCVKGECPVYRKNHPEVQENDANAVADSDPTRVKFVSADYSIGLFEFSRGDLKFLVNGVDNRRGEMTAIVVIERGGKTLYRQKTNLDSGQGRDRVDRKVYEESDKSVTNVARDLMNIGDEISRRLLERARTSREADQKAKQGYVLSAVEEREAIEWAKKDPRILWRMIEFTSRCGLVREKKNRGMLYLMFTSRKQPKPISGIGKGDSSSGKSFLASEILRLLPEEDFREFTRVTAAALNYGGEFSLQNKVLFIREAPGGEEAQMSLRTFISEGDLILMTAEKNDAGKIESREVRIRGPLCFYTTTTAIEVNPENETRFATVYADESKDMTLACMWPVAYQATKGSIAPNPEELKRWRNFQRVLKLGQEIVVPYALKLVEKFPAQNIRARRDFSRMIELIKASAYLHQHHRDWDVGYDAAGNPKHVLIASVADYEIVKALIEGSMMRVTRNVKSGQEELLTLMQDAESSARFEREAGRAFDQRLTFEHGDADEYCWIETPYLREKLGKTQRSTYQLIKALEEEGLVLVQPKTRPLKIRLGDVILRDGEMKLPTIDPEELYAERPQDRAHQYDPLSAPDFDDIYGKEAP